MSTTSDHRQSDLQDHVETNECEYCETEYPAHAQVRGFCSAECFYRQKGATILDEIRRDHRLCATCFRRIKVVEEPPEGHALVVEPPDHDGATNDLRDVLVGYQYRTEHTTWGLDDTSDDAYVTLDRQRWSCECGTVDPSERDDILEDVEIEVIVPNLLRTLQFLERSGAIQQRPVKDRLFEALREEWRDWGYAIGRALYE